MNTNDANTVLMWALREALPFLRRLDSDLASVSHVAPDVLKKLDLILTEMKNATKEVGRIARRPSEDLGNNKASTPFQEEGPIRRTPRYNYWARLSEWSIREAVLLASDCDPETFDETLEIVEASDLYRWITAAQKDESLAQPVSPSSFLRWFDLQGYDEFVLPPRLRQAIVRHQSVGMDAAGSHDAKGPVTPSLNNTPPPSSNLAGDDEIAGTGRLTPNPRTFRNAQMLLVYFMHKGRHIDIAGVEMPYIAQGRAKAFSEDLKSIMKPVGLTDKPVERHLNDAVLTAREAMGKSTTRVKSKKRRTSPRSG